jgi:hypothetical protein
MQKQKTSCNLLVTISACLLFTTAITAQITTGSTETATLKASTKALGIMLPQAQVSLTDLSEWSLTGSAINGTFVYNTNASTGAGIYYWKDGNWLALDAYTTASTYSWSLKGNAGTNLGTNFIGTTDDTPILFKVNNDVAGFTGYNGNRNVGFGWASLRYRENGFGNTAIGIQALEYNTGSENIAIGEYALNINTGHQNVAIGNNTLLGGSGQQNIAIGHHTLKNNTTGSFNTAIGSYSMHTSSLSGGNVAVGYQTLYTNTEGGLNVAVGTLALKNSIASANTAIGFEAMIENTAGSLNTAVGAKALHQNTTGTYNTAVGAQTLNDNTTGKWNVGLGSGALHKNTTGSLNTAVGTSPLWHNETGEQNVAVGQETLSGNVSGGYNTAVGTRALWGVVNVENYGATLLGPGDAYDNTAVGYEAMRDVVSGFRNTAVGRFALRGNANGTYNTAIGDCANVSADNLTNATAIGAGALATESDQVVIGNDAVTSIGGIVNWSALSDDRIKKNVQPNVPGILFINKLKPVTFNLNLGAIAEKPTYSGFIAQEVEEAAQDLEYDFSGVVVPKTENGFYRLRYSEFVVPLVKAVQELSAQNEAKDAAIEDLQKQIDELRELIGSVVNSGDSE